MTPCNDFKAARMRHLAAIAAMERREMEAEAQHQWSKAQTIRESIAWLEHHEPGYRPCLTCANTACPAHFDGHCSWSPMTPDLHPVKL